MDTRLIASEFPLLRRLGRDLDSFFDRVGRFGVDRPFTEPATFAWAPDLELFERGNEFIVRADVPGMKREDVTIEITDSELTIRGERKQEKEEKDKGFYRSERSYGAFFRSIALPDGVKLDQAKATVKDGVLEVKMPLARVEPAKRRIEIQDATAEKSSKHAA
jgi:HSP20 family protein